MDAFARVRDRLLEHRVRPLLLRARVRHVAGPERIAYAADEVLLITIVRNGARHLPGFLDHHFRLGVRHVVLLDNASTDDTVAIARRHPNVTVLSTSVPYAPYENVMKRYLARRFSRGRWNLCVDIDERFDYPESAVLPLPALVRYLDRRGYQGMVAYMLDMFADRPMDEASVGEGQDLRRLFPMYDISAINRRRYRFDPPANPAIEEYHGGIRLKLFGTNNGLTKVPLVRVDDGVDLFVAWHHTRNARLADVTGVLLHYPFDASFHEKVRDALASRRYGQFTAQYEHYWNVLREQPDMTLVTADARRLSDIGQLVHDGFLVESDDFRRWVDAHRQAESERA